MPIQSKFALGLSLLVAVVISFLTLTPIPTPTLGSVSYSDKIYHVLAFAGLTFSVSFLRPNWLIAAVSAYAAFGGIIEVIQPFVGREMNAIDWIADLTGIGLGTLAGRAAAVIASAVWEFGPERTR